MAHFVVIKRCLAHLFTYSYSFDTLCCFSMKDIDLYTIDYTVLVDKLAINKGNGRSDNYLINARKFPTVSF